MDLENKWIRGAIPALFIHCCIGSVYCWSLLKDEIAQQMGTSTSSIEIAFSLAIFFLGMSAAFGGRFIEKNVKFASFLSCLFFTSGLVGSIWAIDMKSEILLFLFYGCVMGIGLGLGYLSPVKTLMLWFSEHKGLATGIAISGFGLSKALFSPFIVWCNAACGVKDTLLFMALISTLFMITAVVLIHKPLGWEEGKEKFTFTGALRIILDPTYLKIWFIFYLNITCGLALIAYEKSLGVWSGITFLGLLSSLTAIFNTVGRFGYSTASDWYKDKSKIYRIIFLSSVIAVGCNIALQNWLLVVVMLCVINAGYGGGFSTLPTLLQSKFGMKRISMIHGFALSAWAWAGLSGNQLSNLILNRLNYSFGVLFAVITILYAIAFLITVSIKNDHVAES
ncbi:MAG: MFS transporter [Bacteroidales bacterium]|nr:MFS transporter [Bacteroidales bacterium]